MLLFVNYNKIKVSYLVRFKVITATSMKMAVFWVVANRPDDGSTKLL
jgi:hypothetical protein